MPQKRRPADSGTLSGRFAKHFRSLIDASGLKVGEIVDKMSMNGHKISKQGLRNYLRGDRYPSPEIMEALAEVLSIDDYRTILPEPRPKSRKK